MFLKKLSITKLSVMEISRILKLIPLIELQDEYVCLFFFPA